MQITAVVLARNAAQSLPACLKSLAWCDERIVMDDNSTDATREIAREAGALVHTRALNDNFAAQRNAAVDLARNDWILFIDSDEIVSPKLKQEIQNIVFSEHVTRARVRRRDHFLGAALTHGEVAAAAQKGICRLVKRGSGSWKGAVHETWHPHRGDEAFLEGYIEHYPHPSVTEFLREVNRYSSIRAMELYTANTPFRMWDPILYPVGKFIYTYFVKMGFRDGAEGFIYSFIMAFHSFLVRAKLFQLRFYGGATP